MTTPIVDLRLISMLDEIVLRGGDFSDPRARESLRRQYERPNVYMLIFPSASPASFVPALRSMS